MKSNIEVFLSRPKKVLIFLSIWLPSGKRHLFLHYLIRTMVMITQYTFLLFELIYIVVVWGDMDEVSEASYLLFTQASVCYKVTVFIVNKKNLKKLLDFMKIEEFAPQSKLHHKLLSSNAKKVKNLCLVFLVSATATCSLWAIMPWFDEAETRRFPFKIWMPLSSQESLQYAIGYLYQILSVYTSAVLFFSVDSTTLSMLMFGCAQLEIIIDKITMLKNVPISSKFNKNEQLKMIEDNNRAFIQCVRQHQEVIRFIQLLEDTYHANIFFQLSGTVGIICIIGLRISIAEPNSVQFYSMLIYMVTMLSQLLLYCWCGNELTTRERKGFLKSISIFSRLLYLVKYEELLRKIFSMAVKGQTSSNPSDGKWSPSSTWTSAIQSEDLREWIYQCPWYEQNAKFRKSLFIVMERMKRPIIFKAGHYIPLSRPTFVSVLRSSYSYFAVLNQAHNK